MSVAFEGIIGICGILLPVWCLSCVGVQNSIGCVLANGCQIVQLRAPSGAHPRLLDRILGQRSGEAGVGSGGG